MPTTHTHTTHREWEIEIFWFYLLHNAYTPGFFYLYFASEYYYDNICGGSKRKRINSMRFLIYWQIQALGAKSSTSSWSRQQAETNSSRVIDLLLSVSMRRNSSFICSSRSVYSLLFLSSTLNMAVIIFLNSFSSICPLPSMSYSLNIHSSFFLKFLFDEVRLTDMRNSEKSM